MEHKVMASMQEEGKVKVKLGPKSFQSSMDMFNYFYNLLHHWPFNVYLNKYEDLALLELVKKGHTEAEKKISGGIRGFQVGKHPLWKSRCFFLIKQDYSVEDFSFRKCVHRILPLPPHMINPSHKPSHNGASRGGRRGRRPHGRGRR
ncbi:protein DCL, chloroplastic [Senna tora]|uniref:Protein DCL, chloroplastic n=1 Tax=Senna tora TaxID=362788 RepID=A0A834W1V4_9FABA|nr:protein DCL, chloroplastic [Senna tora]